MGYVQSQWHEFWSMKNDLTKENLMDKCFNIHGWKY
jgi:hypothetical protein